MLPGSGVAAQTRGVLMAATKPQMVSIVSTDWLLLHATVPELLPGLVWWCCAPQQLSSLVSRIVFKYPPRLIYQASIAESDGLLNTRPRCRRAGTFTAVVIGGGGSAGVCNELGGGERGAADVVLLGYLFERALEEHPQVLRIRGVLSS